MSRREFYIGKSVVSFLGLAIVWSALGTTCCGTDSATASRAEEKRAEKNKFVQELVVLEFIEKDAPQCEKTNALVDEMRRKNYPIQLVERATGGDVLFEQYGVETTPTFVFLVGGKETRRLTVAEESVKDVRDRLLALFRECRSESSKLDAATTTRGQVSELERFARNGAQTNGAQTNSAQTNSARPKYGRTVAVPSKQNSPFPTDSSSSVASNGVANDNSNLAPNVGSYEAGTTISRPNLTQARAFVSLRNSNDERVGNGVVVHYNEEFGEALTLVPAALFAGIDDPLNSANTTLKIISPISQTQESVVGQCVYCDAKTGLAFVAARVASPVAPVAFGSNDAPQTGESAFVATFNDNNEFVPTKRAVLSSDSGYFRLSSGDSLDCRGAGVFLVRNGRLYFSGLYLSNDAAGEGVVVSVALIDRILTSNSNLATVYRDQVTGKYEPLDLASFEPQFSAPLLNSTSRVDLNEANPSTNMADFFKSAEVESNVMDALSKLPTGVEDVPNDPNLRLDSPNAPTLDAAPIFANANVANSTQTSVSDVPSVLKKTLDSDVDATTRESSIMNSSAYDRSIQLATNENQTLDSRAQEIPLATRETDGAFTDMNDVRSTNYASRQNDKITTSNDQETRLFESSLDELRRLSLEGAEIICIVNWSAGSNATRTRETEVVRLPRRKSNVAVGANNSVGVLPQNAEEKKVAIPNGAPSQTPVAVGVSDFGRLR